MAYAVKTHSHPLTHGGASLWLEGQTLMVAAAPDSAVLGRFQGQAEPYTDGQVLKRCPTNHVNAAALRDSLPWLKPVPLGLTTSAGFGDRLGIATPGHVQALLEVLPHSVREIAPIFAQQSIREMTRTRRSPEDVMTDATWGAFRAGWQGQLGADADHLKTTEDIDACAAAGFSFYTIDPGAYVDDEAQEASSSALERKVAALPWDVLEGSAGDLKSYHGRRIDLGDRVLTLEPEAIARAAAKYGQAVAHVVRMYRHIEGKGIPFELEVSVDETALPTSHAEHAYVALELTRLGVRWVSLAPRFVGQFNKGVDYVGDLSKLKEDLAGHAAIARALGPYKLSLHSGSDKFSVYPLIVEATEGLVHLKTAGTSYLEALRVMAKHEPAFFREVALFSYGRYETDSATYHVAADLTRVSDLETMPEGELPDLLESFDARQMLHVAFGSVLDTFKPRLMAALKTHDVAYMEGLAQHFRRHLAPFAGGQA